MSPDLPQRFEFTWDIKSAPWTDAIGPQEGYFEAVQLWKAFHNKLPDSNSNKIPAELQGIILQSQLFGRSKDIRKKIPDSTVQSANGAMAIAAAIHRQDPLSTIIEIYAKFSAVLRTIRRSSESFKNYESPFDAAVSRYNSAVPSSELPHSLTAFVLITNAGLDNNQRISILSAAAPKSSSVDTVPLAVPNVNEVLKKVCYVDVESTLRFFGKPRESHALEHHDTIGASSYFNRFYSGKPRYRKSRTPEEYAELKKKIKCKDCKERGHWSGDSQCRYAANVDAKEKKIHPDHRHPKALAKTQGSAAMTFMANLPRDVSSSDEFDNALGSPGPLVDDGAPWSGLGMQEFLTLQRIIMPSWDGILDELPDPIRSRPYWQYSKGQHASQPRRILGTVVLTIQLDQEIPINIRHVIIEGSSHWVIGRNVTQHADIIHLNGNFLRFRHPETQEVLSLKLINHDLHSYLSSDRFYHSDYHSLCDPTVHALCAQSASVTFTRKDRKQIIDRVHQHVCGHSNFYYISTLLKRNKILNEECPRYLSEVLETCPNCHVVDSSARNRPVSLSSTSR